MTSYKLLGALLIVLAQVANAEFIEQNRPDSDLLASESHIDPLPQFPDERWLKIGDPQFDFDFAVNEQCFAFENVGVTRILLTTV